MNVVIDRIAEKYFPDPRFSSHRELCVMAIKEANAELVKELHIATQMFTENSDWFDALVKDLSDLLRCENKPSAVISAVKHFRIENTTLRALLVKHECPYGHRNKDGLCSLGYPGCACADDAFCFEDEYGRALVAKCASLAKQNAALRSALESISRWQDTESVRGVGEYEQGLLCGLEDRGFQKDGYEAMRFGYDRALERVSEQIDGEIKQALSTTPQ